MENKINDNNNKVVFIDRKKSKPLFQESLRKLKSYLLFKSYKEEKILFRVLYDKIYRPELYTLITKGGSKNLNMTRNLFTMNEDKYEYLSLKKNDSFSFEDDETYMENSFVLKVHKCFLIHKFTLYLSVPLALGSLYYLFINKAPMKANFCFVSCLIILVFNLGNLNKKEKLYKDDVYKNLAEINKKSFDLYKNFYYDL